MKKFNSIFRDYIGYILSLLVVLGYILTGVFILNDTGKTLTQILIDSFIIFVLGVLLSNTMGLQGLNDGDHEESVKKSKLEHASILLETQPYWLNSPKFCEYKNKTALRQERERILNFATLNYNDFFDSEGRFIGKFIKKTGSMKKFIDRQNEAIRTAVSLEITQITPSDLVTENAKPNDPLARGRSKVQYITQSNVRDVFVKVATAIFGGIYTAQFIGADFGEIAYRVVIAIILLAFGVVRYYANFRFVTGENNDRTVMATHWLKEFKTLNLSGFFTPKVKEEIKEEIKEETTEENKEEK